MMNTQSKTPALTFVERTAAAQMTDAAIKYFSANTKTRRLQLRDARNTYASLRRRSGFADRAARLLTAPGSQPKTDKNAVPTFTLMLAPARTSGIAKVNLCPSASHGCEMACLNTAGRGAMSSVQRGRVMRTDFLIAEPEAFGVILASEIFSARVRYVKFGLRLNCLSDIRWELVSPDFIKWAAWNGAVMYDYTAYSPERRNNSGLPYHLTYSAKETHDVSAIRQLIESGNNVAVPFSLTKKDKMITEWEGMPVIDGDVTDYRVNDPKGVIVGLRAKGSKGKSDNSGFIRKV